MFTANLMKTPTHFIGLRALFPLATVLLTAVCANAATPDAAPARSVKNVKFKISPNGRYFVDQNGKPFFYLGDTCWLLFQRLNHEELDEYLKDRAAKGFTVIQAYVLRGLGKQHPDGNSSLLDATPLIDRDPTRPNEEFFKNADYVMTPPKPTLDMEPAYENHPTGTNKPRVNSHKVRTQAYSAMLARAAGHGYGSLDLFWFYKDADGPFPKSNIPTGEYEPS